MKLGSTNNKNDVFTACINGEISLIQKKINRNFNLGYYNKFGETPLILATINNHNNIVKELCKYKKNNINCIDENGYTALYYAVENNNYENVENLLHYGANYRIILEDGTTPMSYAYMMGYHKIIKLLHDYGESVPNNYLGLSRKRIRTEKPKEIILDKLLLSIKNNNKEDLLKCLKEGYNINQRYFENHTIPIIYATELGNLEMIKLLYENGADLNLLDSIGNDAYFIAEVRKYTDIINYFNSLK
jgi:ankyrin repeat protein